MSKEGDSRSAGEGERLSYTDLITYPYFSSSASLSARLGVVVGKVVERTDQGRKRPRQESETMEAAASRID
jgi:hypothetical protein